MSRSVLIVEDDEFILDAMRDSLEMAGYDVSVAVNGKDAMNVLAQIQKPNVIFLDLMMPVMDGYQFCAAQSEDKRISDIPVVIVSADGNAQQKAKNLGVRGGLKKPLELEELLEMTKAICG